MEALPALPAALRRPAYWDGLPRRPTEPSPAPAAAGIGARLRASQRSTVPLRRSARCSTKCQLSAASGIVDTKVRAR